MQEQISQSQPHEKVMTMLHRNYSQALYLLKRGHFPQGIQQLIDILHHKYINDSDMENLKYSALISLAEVHQSQGDLMSAVGFLWKGLEILEHRWEETQKGQVNGRQQEERSEVEFTLILKMVFLVEKLNRPEELVYLLKKAIRLSPLLWREKLVSKLRQTYEQEQKHEALGDLQYLIQNKEKMQQILSEKIQDLHMPSAEFSPVLVSEEPQSYLKKITIYVNLDQKDEIFLKYNSWQTLFTVSYVLLKCQNNRNFNRKKYLHKKFDENNKQWCQFLKKFSITDTKIQILLLDIQEDPEKIDIEIADQEPNYGKIVGDLANELLRIRYLRKKSKKQINPLEELTRIPSISVKDQKKVVAVAQTKSIFSSISEYFRQLFSKNHFKKECLYELKAFDQDIFTTIFGQIVKNQPEVMKPEGDENEEDDLEGSFSLGQGISEGEKDCTKEKKSHKTRKAQIIAFQKQLSSFMKVLLKSNDDSCISFANVCEMTEKIIGSLFAKNEHAQKNTSVVSNPGIRKVLQKNILKVIEVGDGFFDNIDSLDYMQLLMEKLEQLIEKDVKSKPFKEHQERKKQLLANFIKDRFQPTTYQVQQLLQKNISHEQLKRTSQICFSLIKLNSFYGMCKPQEVLFYRDLYIIFKTKEQLKSSQIFLSKQQIEKKVTIYIDKQIDKYQKKVTTKSSLLAINEQNEENINSVDQIYKKDQQISAILPLLKVYNCHPDQLKAKPSEISQEINPKVYLESFSKVSELFFKKIEIQSKKQFNSRLLTLLSEIVRIKQIITFLYDKFMDGVTFKSISYEVDSAICTQTVFYLLKFYLLTIVEDNDYCLKICFYIINSLLRSGSYDNQKYIIIPKLICTFDELIKYRKTKPQSMYSVRKRFYQQIILKNINYIYKSPLFEIKGQKTSNKSKKSNKPRNSSDQEPCEIEIVDQKQEDHQGIRERVYDILHNIYFCPQKDREFTPKRIEESVGYFMYLLRAYHEMFEDKVIELQNQALKIFKKCYKLYLQKIDEVYSYCQKFKDFFKAFNLIMNGQSNKIDEEEFLSIVRQKKNICECCLNISDSHQYYVQSLFVLGKFYEAQFAQTDLSLHNREQWLEDVEKDEKYYLQYLALNLGKQAAWENLIRVNTTKTFYYFDSLLNEPFERFKNKFFFTKKLIHFVSQTSPQFTKIIGFGSANLEILNILKIKEREYLMIQKQIQTMGISTKESRQLQKKYAEGVKRIFSSTSSQSLNDVRIRYLRMSEIKFKIIWNNFDRDAKEDKPQQSSVIIQLDGESDESRIVHPPTKNLLQLEEIIFEITLILSDLPSQAQNDSVLHLEEDIIMETYIFLSKHLERKLLNILQSLCLSITSSKKIKDVQFYLSDLSHTINLFKKGDFITNNQKYKINDDNLIITGSDLTSLQLNFSKIFLYNQRVKEEKVMEEDCDQPIIILNEEDNGQINPDLNKSKESEQSVGKSSKRSHSKSSSKNKSSKTINIDFGKYVSDIISQYIVNNELFSHPLNHVQGVLNTSLFQSSILKISKIMSQLCRIATDLPKFQLKRHKNRRSVVMSLLYCSHLAVSYANAPQRANQLVKEYYSFKNEQFTTINLYNQKIAAEKNELLSDFYNRTIVHNIMKIQFIRQIFNIFQAQGHKDNLVLLNKKLLKLSKLHEPKIEKQKTEKSQPKQAMEAEGQTKKEVKLPAKVQKEGKEGKDLQSTTYFFLFCQGALKLSEMLKKQSQAKPVDEKYQKNILQFRNKIKKWSNDEKNVYYQKIQDFISWYQNRYDKKIKLKKTKKDKEIGENPILMENVMKNVPSSPVGFQKIQLSLVQPEIVLEKSHSIKSHSSKKSNTPKMQRTPVKKFKVIEKKGKQRVPRARKNQIPKEIPKKKMEQQGNASKPIEIKESPQKEDSKGEKPKKQVEIKQRRRATRVPRVKSMKIDD